MGTHWDGDASRWGHIEITPLPSDTFGAYRHGPSRNNKEDTRLAVTLDGVMYMRAVEDPSKPLTGVGRISLNIESVNGTF